MHQDSNGYFGFLFFIYFALALLVAFADQVTGQAPKTNVLFILADDLGWRDLSNEGSSFYESPHIDRIANEGMKFNSAFLTCSSCSPSRCSTASACEVSNSS